MFCLQVVLHSLVGHIRKVGQEIDIAIASADHTQSNITALISLKLFKLINY